MGYSDGPTLDFNNSHFGNISEHLCFFLTFNGISLNLCKLQVHTNHTKYTLFTLNSTQHYQYEVQAIHIKFKGTLFYSCGTNWDFYLWIGPVKSAYKETSLHHDRNLQNQPQRSSITQLIS